MTKRAKLRVWTLIVLVSIAIAIALRYLFLENLALSYMGTTPRTGIFKPEYTWMEITSEDQRQYYLEEFQLKLPEIDFSNNNMIISKHKIYKAYYAKYECSCDGAPNGLAVFNYLSSRKKIYIYKIPKILISQGVG
ncbi:hypothetical protein D3C75_369560 [compost metagenome]